MSKEKMDRFINIVFAIAVIAILLGDLILIWIGAVGGKIMLTGISLLAWDFMVNLWTGQDGKENRGGSGR